MRFSTITFKNIRFNIKQYKAIFLSITFGICMLFMFSSFYFNDALMGNIKSKVDLGTIRMSFMVLIIFLTVFFSYAYKEFINGRKKEFALYMSLGMTAKNVFKIIVVENTVIMTFAWLLGVITGSVFSNLFHMIITKLLGITNIAFRLNKVSFIITLALLVISFIFVLFVSMFSINKLSITELKKADQSINKLNKQHPFLAFISLLLIIIPIIVLSLSVRGIINLKPYTAFIDVLISLIGVFFFIAYGGDLVVRLLSKNKKRYYKNLLPLKEVNKRFFQLRKVLFVLSIGSLAVIYLIGLSVGMAVTVNDVANNKFPYDISYILDESDKAKFEQQLYAIASSGEAKIQQYKSCNSINLYELREHKGKKRPFFNIDIVKQSDANKHFDKNFQLQNNEIIYIINEIYTKSQLYDVGGDFTITNQDKSMTYTKQIKQVYIGNLSNRGHWVIVVTDDIYDKMLNENKGKLVTHYTYKYDNLPDTMNIYKKLEQRFDEIKLERFNGELDSREASNFKYYNYPLSKQYHLEREQMNSKFIMFIMFYIAIIFFVTSGVVLYLRVINSIEHSKKRFNTLNQLGMCKADIKSIIGKELILVFLLPVIFGGLLAMALTYGLYYSFLSLNKILLSLAVCTLLYLLLQVIFFSQAKRKFVNEILKDVF